MNAARAAIGSAARSEPVRMQRGDDRARCLLASAVDGTDSKPRMGNRSDAIRAAGCLSLAPGPTTGAHCQRRELLDQWQLPRTSLIGTAIVGPRDQRFASARGSPCKRHDQIDEAVSSTWTRAIPKTKMSSEHLQGAGIRRRARAPHRRCHSTRPDARDDPSLI